MTFAAAIVSGVGGIVSVLYVARRCKSFVSQVCVFGPDLLSVCGLQENKKVQEVSGNITKSIAAAF